MTLPKGYKAPNKKEISDNKDFGNNNSATNKKSNSLTDEILQSTTIDDTINKVLERGKEVVTNLEDPVKESDGEGVGIQHHHHAPDAALLWLRLPTPPEIQQ